MFNTLRKQFVATTMALISVVLVVAFGGIYAVTANRLGQEVRDRPVMIDVRFGVADRDSIQDYLDEQRQGHVDKTLRGLAATLLVTGSITLAAAYFVSRYVADRAIRPVREAYDKQKQFVADASHELKTPLAVIDSSIDAEMTDRKRPSKWLTNIQSETSRMNQLVGNLLTLARLESTGDDIAKKKFDVSKTVQKVVSSLTTLADEKRVSISLYIEKSLNANSNVDKFRQIVTILLDNAIKYTDRGGKIEVSTLSDGRRAEVVVSNTHTPLSDDELERLFDRFYQTDKSHQEKGYGLGLSIAKAAAEQIGAGLRVSQADGRISFTLTLER